MNREYSKSFIERLASGEVMIRRIWKNEGKENFAVQYMQQIPSEDVSPEQAILAASMDFTPAQRVTAIFAASPAKLEKEGISEGYFCYEGDATLSAKKFLGIDVEIDVVENTEKNPLQPKQEPKINPTTGEVLTFNGKPIYRHTRLVPKGAAKRKFLASGNTIESEDSKESLERSIKLESEY